nr:hypothetical protein [Erwinia sp. S38]
MHFTSQYMSIKPLFLNIWPEHVYGIDTSGRYVDKTRFFKHVGMTCLWYRYDSYATLLKIKLYD